MTQSELQNVNAAMTKVYAETATNDTVCIAVMFDKTTDADGMAFISKNCTIDDAVLMTRSIAAAFDIEVVLSTDDDDDDRMYR